MKKYTLIFLTILFNNVLLAQNNIGVGTVFPNSSAILDITSKTKGLLIPRMSTTERTSIASPANGLMVYDTVTNSLWYYNVNAWTSFTASGALSFPYSATVNTNISAFKITNQGFGAGIEGNSSADYGIGLKGSSTGVGGWGVNASAIRDGAIALYAFSDSGTAINATNNTITNTNTLLNLQNFGSGKTASFQMLNTASTSPSVQMASNGKGQGLLMYLTNPLNESAGIELNNAGLGQGLDIKLTNSSNASRGINVQNDGSGPGVYAVTQGSSAIWGTAYAVYGSGVRGDHYGEGEAVVGICYLASSISSAVVGRCEGPGYGVRGFSSVDGIGVCGQAGLSGSTGIAGIFENVNGANSKNVLIARGAGTGTTLVVSNTNAATGNNLATFIKGVANVARINDAGKGFFNGGTQNSGADVAEMFDVSGERSTYEPGDVLVISTEKDRTIEKSSGAYSTLVVGVYATKPGVILTEAHIDANNDMQVPMGVIGVIPTKVCLEGGPIKRGDMLVTSSTSGVAMKADMNKVKTGQVIGKAVENFSADEIGKIKVLVNIK